MSSKKFFNQYSWKALEPFQLCLIMLMVLLPLGLMAQIGSTVSNVAKGKTARQSSGGDPARGSASKAVDGNTSGVWTYDNNTITHTNEENNPWWELDLGGVYDVSEIKVWNRTDDCCWARLQNFYVMLSETPIEANSTTVSQYASGPIWMLIFAMLLNHHNQPGYFPAWMPAPILSDFISRVPVNIRLSVHLRIPL